MKRWGLLLGAVVVLAAVAGGLVWALRGSGVTRWVRDPRSALKPAPLSPLHEAVEELRDCNACHALDEAIPSEKCLSCHEEIQRRRDQKIGHHGRDLRGVCHDCHVDHEETLIVFDRDAFNHQRALFPLRGLHSEVRCEKCHERRTGVTEQFTRMQYIGLEHDTCAACHEDPHQGTLTADGRACTVCHDENGWGGRTLHFVHDRDSAFHLDGQHADVGCAACHVPPEGSTRLADAPLAGLGTACATCHQDPHAGQFADTACETCHTARGFTGDGLRFRHESVAEFRLEGKHAAVACADCHVDDEALGARRFRGTSTDCASCHQDPHGAQFAGTTCAACHAAEGFRVPALRFDHRTVADFPLGGKHVVVECARCHVPQEGTPTTFRGAPTDCSACHEDPHAGQLADTPCASCHRDTGFEGDEVAFRHARLERFPLSGAHAGVACASCHKAPAEGQPVVLRGMGTACSACHEDPHAGSVADKACATCHASAGWRGTNLLFDHRKDAAFAMDATHERVPCASCHASAAFRPLAADCAGCHAAEAEALEGRSGELTFDASPHAGLVACAKCHLPEDREATAAVVAPRCASCHTPRYAKLALDQQTLLDGLLLRGRSALTRHPEDTAARDRLEALRRAGAHDFAPAALRLRELVEALER